MTTTEGTKLAPEDLGKRLFRQIAEGLDEDRLMPAEDTRRRQVNKTLDKLANRKGWYTFAVAAAHTIAEGSEARRRRNAEIQLVTEAARWTRDVERFAPERLDEYRKNIEPALAHPAPLPARD